MTEQTPTPPAAPAPRRVELTKQGEHRFKATNERGGVITLGHGDDPDFTPVELLLAAVVGCSALDVDFITGKRAPFETFLATAEGTKLRDESGNHLDQVRVTFDVTFPAGEAGDAARAVLASAIQMSQDRLCTVGRTVALETPVHYVEGDLGGARVS